LEFPPAILNLKLEQSNQPTMKTIKLFCLFLFSVVAATGQENPQNQKYALGSQVKPFEANDQHGEAYKLDANTRYLLLSFDMSTGKVANSALTKKERITSGGKRLPTLPISTACPELVDFLPSKK
jgi:hypothetical protein